MSPFVAFAGLLNKLLGRTRGKATPPITSNDEFYVPSYRSPPTVRIADWQLRIHDLVERPLTLDYAQLLAKPTVSQIVTLECVGNTVAGEFIITAEWEGVPLPQGHGFPARMIVPGVHGMKHVQWLIDIEIVDQDYKGYHAKGWADEAVIKTMSRIDLPGHGSTIKGLRQKVEGPAFAATRGVRHVELSTGDLEASHT